MRLVVAYHAAGNLNLMDYAHVIFVVPDISLLLVAVIVSERKNILHALFLM